MKSVFAYPGILDVVIVFLMLYFYLGSDFFPATYFMFLFLVVRTLLLLIYDKSHFLVSFKRFLFNFLIAVSAVLFCFVSKGGGLGAREIIAIYLGSISLVTILIFITVGKKIRSRI
jgi:hypothetical protein